MKRTTSALLTGALASGGALVLSVAAPGLAAADSCGPSTVNQHQFADLFNTDETRATGHNDFSYQHPDAVRVWTEGNANQGPRTDGGTGDWNTDKAAAYFELDQGIPLDEQTSNDNYGLEMTAQSGGGPGYNLVVDLDGDTATNSDVAILVNEAGFYDGRWWTHKTGAGVTQRDGYPSSGSLDEYVDANPGALILSFGYSLGSGVQGDVLLDSITFGCNVFDFVAANRDPVADFTMNNAGDDDWRTVRFVGEASDPDGDELPYYGWDYGDGTGGGGDNPGALNTHVITYDASGDYQVTLTVRDGKGGEAVVTKTITVRPTETVQGNHLPTTGANVLGLASVGAVVLAGGAAGAMATRRRRASAGA